MAFRLGRAALCALIAASFAARADFIDLWANKTDMPLNKAPRSGKSRLLLIPVQIDFTGAKGSYPPIDLARLKTFFTAEPSADLLNFRGFFEVASSKRYQPEVVVAPLVKYDGCPAMLASSADCTIGRGDVSAIKAGMDFVRDVFRRTHDEGKVDFSKLDINGQGGEPDGFADGVMMVVNTPGVGIAFPIAYVNSGSDLAGGIGGPLVLDGVKVPYVAIGGASYVKGVPRFEYVVLHEFGHVLGLADLYYEHPPAGDPYPSWEGLHFSLMGDYSYDDKATLPDAESRRALNWQQTIVASGTQTLTLQPAAAGGAVVKLGQMGGKRKEYFLAEVRGPVGPIDRATDGSGKPIWGLAVYHVDWARGPKAQLGAWTERLISCLDCDPFHPFLRNLESSNQWGLVFAGPSKTSATGAQTGLADDRILFTETGIASIDNPGTLSRSNRYTATNYYDGSSSGVVIENVHVNPDHSVTATFTAPAVDDPCADVVCAPSEQCMGSGARAGNCEALQLPSADGGQPDAGHTADLPPPPRTLSGGCSTGSGAAALLLPLALVALLISRRRRPV